MVRRNLVLIAGLALALGAVCWPSPATPAPTPPARGWEYKVVMEGELVSWDAVSQGKPWKDQIAQHLNKLGEEGWELVAVEHAARTIPTFYFKRPR
jgi:hypothetical protein